MAVKGHVKQDAPHKCEGQAPVTVWSLCNSLQGSRGHLLHLEDMGPEIPWHSHDMSTQTMKSGRPSLAARRSVGLPGYPTVSPKQP